MGTLYLFSWYYQGTNGQSSARHAFEKLRDGADSFLILSPYEISLVHCAIDEHCCIGMLGQSGPAGAFTQKVTVLDFSHL